MPDNQKPRKRRTPDEIVAEIDRKIKSHHDAIKNLEAKKESVLAQKKRAATADQMKAIINAANNAGMSMEEIAEKLGVAI